MNWMALSSGLVLAVMTLGCSGNESEVPGRPERTEVSGTITMNGSPVEGATVTLRPVQGGHSAVGITDSSGKYVLGTFDKGDGVVPGEYLVTVTKLDAAAGGAQPTPDDPNYNPNAKQEPPKHLLPVKFADATASGLKASITATPNNALDFDLK